MPGLTVNTSGAAGTPAQSSTQIPGANANASTSATAQDAARPSSPQRPTYSPITPPLNPVAFPPRPTYTHSSQQDQVGIAPPPPEPIDFESNPDVLALKSAISILQLQKRKATADMALLSRIKTAALNEPEAFVRDLTEGRVGTEGDALFGGSSSGAQDDDDDDSDEEDDEQMEDTPNKTAPVNHLNPSPNNTDSHSSTSSGNRTLTDSAWGSHSEAKSEAESPLPQSQTHPSSQPSSKPQPRPWARLPKPQNVVRCPPINWAQYAVVGDSLDKLHAEQLSRPAQGVPATLGPDGRYEFKGEPGRQDKYVGVAAPYAPGKDRVERKTKGPKR